VFVRRTDFSYSKSVGAYTHNPRNRKYDRRRETVIEIAIALRRMPRFQKAFGGDQREAKAADT
jgi:hypothetical protein